MSARKRVRRFLAAPSTQPDAANRNELLHRRWLTEGRGKYVDLRVQDLQTLLRSEREARRAAAVQSRKAAEAAQAAQRNQDAYLRERAERLKRGAEIRNTVSELSRKISDPPGSHERRVRELSEALARAYAGSPSRQDAERLRAENRELTAERDRWQRTAEARGKDVRNLVAERDSLRQALNNLSAEDVRKIAQDLLPQFLETFFKGGKK